MTGKQLAGWVERSESHLPIRGESDASCGKYSAEKPQLRNLSLGMRVN